MEKIVLTGLTPEQIAEQLELSQLFRGKQIFKWIYSHINDFSKMTNLSKELRETLEKKAVIRNSSVNQVLKDPDGTIKLQIKLHDGLFIETVLLTDKNNRKTACVSCQAGCAMKCAFCQTGTLGLARNLTAGEIIEQFMYLEEEVGTLDNIVFMGMGEPLMNLPEIRKAISILSSKEARNLSTRRITLSTCGIIQGIYDLADNGPIIRLAVSLTTADPKLREQIMPIQKANPLDKLKVAISYYAQKTGRRVTLEAALLHNQNTNIQSAKQMIDFAKGIDVNINLIPWNPISTLPFSEPSPKECKNFVQILENAGLNVTLRTRRGRTIQGACGQLGKTIVSSKENTNIL